MHQHAPTAEGFLKSYVNSARLGKNVEQGLRNESGRKKPKIKPQKQVKPPMRTNSQNHPGLPATPRMCRIP
ncbi:hypothetical protein KCU77_g1, partial [Aureobasidium melanogenum]